MDSPLKHVLFVALPAFGHITPLMELAKKLTHYNFHITFAVSEAKVAEMQARGYLPEHYKSTIELYALKDGLPVDIDTRPSPGHLEEMQGAMEGPLGELLENMPSSRDTADVPSANTNFVRMPVDVVVCDSTMYQPPAVCAKRGIPCFYCHTPTPVFLAMIGSGCDLNSFPTEPDDSFFEPADSSKPFSMPVGMLNHMKKMQAVMKLSTGWVVNGFEEMDDKLFSTLQQLPGGFGKKLYYVGPLLPLEEKQRDPEKAVLAEKVTNWLNHQTTGSVIYVSFGSMVFPQPAELCTLGEVLLSLGQPFIFSLRVSQQGNLPSAIQEKIAQQFDTADAKFLVVPWVQQQEVLAHPATRVFLSHCGYNSTLETLTYGKPVVAWPFFGDQSMNADYLVGLGMAVRITETALRTKKVTTKEELTAALTTVGGWTDGAIGEDKDSYLVRAQEMAVKAKTAVSRGGSSYKNFHRLVEILRE